jgi:anti-sigma-K factor RskA
VRYLPRLPHRSGRAATGEDDLHDLAGAYALDALDDVERARFERHLESCQACAAEVRGFAAIATAMATAVAAEPPAGLKPRVLAGVAVTRQLPPVPADAADQRRSRRTRAVGTRDTAGGDRTGGASTGGAGTGGAGRGGGVSPRPFGLVPKIATGVAAASLAAAAVLAVVAVHTHDELSTAQAHGAAIAAVLTAPDATIVSGQTSAGGTATVVTSQLLGQMVFTSAGMPALPASQVYQLWFIGAGGARSAGLVPAPGVRGTTAPVLASGLLSGDKIGVTVEPAGGTSAPTTTPIVLLSVPA